VTTEQAALIEAVSERKSSRCVECDETFVSPDEARAHSEDFGHAVLDYHGARSVN